MASKSDDILEVMRGLKSRHGEISACMVAKRGLEGVIMFPESFKAEMLELWEPVESTVDQVLNIISDKSSYKLDKAYVELLGYGVLFYVMPGSDTALVIFIRLEGRFDVFDFMSKNSPEVISARDDVIRVIERG